MTNFGIFKGAITLKVIKTETIPIEVEIETGEGDYFKRLDLGLKDAKRSGTN